MVEINSQNNSAVNINVSGTENNSSNINISDNLARYYSDLSDKYAKNAKIWAEGTDTEVSGLGGIHSAKEWYSLSADKNLSNLSSIGNAKFTAKQDILVSGTNIKTINNNSILGSGNVDIGTLPSQSGQSGKFLTTDGTDASWGTVDLSSKQDILVSGTNIKTINNNSILGSGNVDIDTLPSQSGQSGKFLTTDGTDASWGTVDALPSQTGQSGKYLTTDGSSASWGTVSTGLSGLSDVQITSIANNDILIYNSTDSKFENLNANPMIESYVNGTSGYNIWSNGYCEQWGYFNKTASGSQSVSLIKIFANTDYNVYLTPKYSANLANMSVISAKNTSNFVITGNNNGTNTYYEQWKACGYLASSSDSSSSGSGVIGGNDDPFG